MFILVSFTDGPNFDDNEEEPTNLDNGSKVIKSCYYRFCRGQGTQLLPSLTPHFKGCTAAYSRVVLKDPTGRELMLSTGAIVRFPRAKIRRVFIAGLEFLGVSPYQYKDPVVSLTLLLVELRCWTQFKGGKV